MCRAVIREMHIEIHKHALRRNGEDDIYETVPVRGVAIRTLDGAHSLGALGSR